MGTGNQTRKFVIQQSSGASAGITKYSSGGKNLKKGEPMPQKEKP